MKKKKKTTPKHLRKKAARQRHQMHPHHPKAASVQDHKAKGGARRPVTEADLPRVMLGTYQASSDTYGFVVPLDRKYEYDIFISHEDSLGAADGEMVRFEITRPATNRHKPEGRIAECLGFVDDTAGNDVLYIAKAYDLPMEWSEKVKLQTSRVAQPVSQADIDYRRDLRALPMVTIDGADARDLDDAVSLEYDEGRREYILGVHIADVSNYVQEGSALDKEALKRGTSVYLVDRVIPMLPVELSNGICSLNAGQERLAISCIMHISPDSGEVTDYNICESVICVDERMTYDCVSSILNGTYENAPHRFTEMFMQMQELSHILRERRRRLGASEFDFPEPKVILGDGGEPIDVVLHESNNATRLIEDFMLTANETIARHFATLNLPLLYRVHETPPEEKITTLQSALARYGLYIQGDITPGKIAHLLEHIMALEDSGQRELLSRMVLRSMSQARYTPESLGHFGLGLKYYCHFTSPIRRYPDLIVHRIIRDYLHGRLDDRRINHYSRLLPKVGEQTSELERRAERAERDSVKMKMAEYMSCHIGESYNGIISGVTGWGMYVELPNGIEGMVPLRELTDDYYIYNEDTQSLSGERTGRTYTMGDSVSITVTRADKAMRQIDFVLAADELSETY